MASLMRSDKLQPRSGADNMALYFSPAGLTVLFCEVPAEEADEPGERQHVPHQCLTERHVPPRERCSPCAGHEPPAKKQRQEDGLILLILHSLKPPA